MEKKYLINLSLIAPIRSSTLRQPDGIESALEGDQGMDQILFEEDPVGGRAFHAVPLRVLRADRVGGGSSGRSRADPSDAAPDESRQSVAGQQQHDE